MMRDVIRAGRMQVQCYLTAHCARDRCRSDSSMEMSTGSAWPCTVPNLDSTATRGRGPSKHGSMRHHLSVIALGTAVALSAFGLASAQGTSESGPSPVLEAPVDGMHIQRLFEPPAERWLAGHRGIDLLVPGATEVYSPGPGTVAFAGRVVNRPVLSIDLDSGLRSSVEPVATLVEVGQRVSKGELVGTVDDAPGAGHCEPQWCVHWGLRKGDDYVNPLDWVVGYGPIQLLTLTDSGDSVH